VDELVEALGHGLELALGAGEPGAQRALGVGAQLGLALRLRAHVREREAYLLRAAIRSPGTAACSKSSTDVAASAKL
jgi:hypothetical protein